MRAPLLTSSKWRNAMRGEGAPFLPTANSDRRKFVRRIFYGVLSVTLFVLATATILYLNSRDIAGASSRLSMRADHQASARMEGTPRISLPKCPAHLGKGAPGETLTASIPIENVGGGTLRITRLEVSCGCAGYKLSQDTLHPGEKATLEVKARLKAEGERLRFYAKVQSNDPVTPTAIYEMFAEAPAILWPTPDQLSFGAVPIGTQPIRRLSIVKGEAVAGLRPDDVDISLRHGRVDIQDAKFAGSAVDLQIAPRPSLPAGDFSDVLIVRHKASNREIEVLIQGYVAKSIIASPDVLYFGEISAKSEPVKRHFVLRRADRKALEGPIKHAAPSGLTVEAIEPSARASERSTRRFVVTLDSALWKPSDRARIALWLGNEAEPVEIEVMAYQKK